MASAGIVVEFDVPGNVSVCMIPRRILGAVNTLVLECGEERLGQRIVETDSRATSRLAQVQTF